MNQMFNDSSMTFQITGDTNRAKNTGTAIEKWGIAFIVVSRFKYSFVDSTLQYLYEHSAWSILYATRASTIPVSHVFPLRITSVTLHPP